MLRSGLNMAPTNGVIALKRAALLIKMQAEQFLRELWTYIPVRLSFQVNVSYKNIAG